MLDHWEILDLYKALLAVAAGAVLGMERELKDKAAGLKTITVICLGSALFTILSYKLGAEDGESTRIASYIVSGIGFIGAGVIFKDRLDVSGLTTAGIIWLAAAVGMAIGFGEFYVAATFIVAALFTIFTSKWINKLVRPSKQGRDLIIELNRTDGELKQRIIEEIRAHGIMIEEKRLELKDGRLILSMEATFRLRQMRWLENYLIQNEHIVAFTF